MFMCLKQIWGAEKMEYLVMFCHMEEFLPRIAKSEESLMAEIKKDRTLIDGLLDIIRGIKNNLAIKFTKSEKAMLDEAERNAETILKMLQKMKSQ